MPLPELILASSSPQRRKLLTEAGYPFEVVAPRDDAECGICSQCGPAELVADLSLRKALDVVEQLSTVQQSLAQGRLLVACDTVAECGGQILGKPDSEEHAADMLRRLRGTVHRVYSGLTVGRYSRRNGLQSPRTRLAVSELFMKPVSDGDLADYLASGLWEGKAGALGFQDNLEWLELREGSVSNVIGLPMELLEEMLASEV